MRTLSNLILLLCIVVLASSSVTVKLEPLTAAAPAKTNDDSWDYLLLIDRWPQTVCETTTKCYIPDNVNHFSLHGIWANRNDTSGPGFCTKEKFDKDQVEDLWDDLRLYWTDFQSKSGEASDFYKHEWEKHGTCSSSDVKLSTQHKFFSSALRMRKGLNLTQVLEDAGVSPSSSTMYQEEDFVRPISARYTTPLLWCKQSQGKTFLLHMRFCFDKDLSLMECNDAEKKMQKDQGQCGQGFYYPPIQH